MEKRIINFKASGQSLQRISGIVTAASDTVRYFEARFVLDESWEDFDSVRAIWVNGDTSSVRVLNHGVCEIPSEVLTEKNKLKVNLVGSTAEGGALVDRLTTFQCPVFGVTAKVPIDSPNPPDIPASQVEQFAEIVRDDADRADAAAIAAGASAQSASESMASASASETAAAASASNAADSAQASADSATASANSAAASASSASQSQGYAQAASESAGSASGSANRSLASAQASASSATDSANSATASANSASASQTFANNAELHAHNAEISAQSAETSADEAEQAKDTILGMRADATTLPEGSDATASYSDGLLMLGIPRGDKGNPPNLSIGTVETLDPDEDATATITGTAENPILSFGIPKGDTGEVSLSELEDSTVVQTLSDSVPYNYRRTNNGNGSGHREYDEIVGASVGWNQLVDPSSTRVGSTNGITLTYDSTTHKFKASGTATAFASVQITSREIPSIGGHKYFLPQPNGASATTYFLRTSSDLFWNFKNIGMETADVSQTFRFVVQSGQTVDVEFYLQLIDLTLMNSQIADYVYGLEQSTAGSGVSWLKSHFPKLFTEYQPFDAGSIKSVIGLTAHEMVGKNQWDASQSFGLVDAYQSNGNPTRRKGAELHLPQGAYTFSASKIGSEFAYIYVNKVNSDGSFAHFEYLVTNGVSAGFTLNLSDGQYFVIYDAQADRESIQTKFGSYAIQIEAGSTETYFEPYIKHSYLLDSSATLRGKYYLDSNHQLKADGDIYPPSGEIERIWTEVALSDLVWHASSTANRFYATLPQGYPMLRTNTMICSKYMFDGIGTSPNRYYGDNKTIRYYWQGGANTYEIYVHDDSYSDLTSFVNGLGSASLVYPLATPTTEAAAPYESPQWCDSHGTEEYVGSELPVGHNTTYPMSLVDTIPKDDGSYTIQVDVANGKPSVSWVMPASASMIAPTEVSYVATRNYTSGSLLIVNGTLYKATANIANNGNIVPNTNCVATTLADVISALA